MNNGQMVFKVPGVQQFEDFSFDYEIVEEEDVPQAVADGWFASLQEARQAAAPKPADPPQP